MDLRNWRNQLYRNEGSGVFRKFALGGTQHPFGSENPPEFNRFYWSRGGLSPHSPLNTTLNNAMLNYSPLLNILVLDLEKYVFLHIGKTVKISKIKKIQDFFKPKSTYRKNLNIPNSLDFLGFFTYVFLHLSTTYFHQKNGYKNAYVICMENMYFYIFRNLKICMSYIFLSFRVSKVM